MRLIIIGAGGHGQVVREVAVSLKKYLTENNMENIIFLDDRYREAFNIEQRYGTIAYNITGICENYWKYIDEETEFYPAFGDNVKRLEWEEKISQTGGKIATIIHPTAYIAESVKIKSGTVIFPKAIVNSGCEIGHACIINMGAIIDHGCILEDGCHINSGAIVMAENYVPKYTKVESGGLVEVCQWTKTNED